MAKENSAENMLQTVNNQPLTTTFVNSFVAELKADVQELVRNNVQAIVEAQRGIVTARLTIGRCLAELHTALGKESYNQFCLKVLAKIGISRTTAYRYYSGFKMVHGQFGTLANDVLALTDGGNSLVKPNPKGSDMIFTPEVKAVMAKMPKVKDNAPPEDREKWARTFVTLVAKEGRGAAKKTTAVEQVEAKVETILNTFDALFEKVNKIAGAKERRESLDAIFEGLEKIRSDYDKLAKTINAIPQAKTGSKAKMAKATA